jgi:hypothetical protein
MWHYYKRILIALQLATAFVCWMVYRAAAPDLAPVATAFIVMQVGAVAGSIWANRLRKRVTCSVSRLFN